MDLIYRALPVISEIKRGKLNWVYGYLVYKTINGKKHSFIVDSQDGRIVHVINTSIGVYFGKKDKDDTRIFTGDRCKLLSNDKIFPVVYDESRSCFSLQDSSNRDTYIQLSTVSEGNLKVIGNYLDFKLDK